MKHLFLGLATLYAMVSYSQNDSIALTNKVLKCYNNLLETPRPQLKATDACISNAKTLKTLKKNNTKLSMVLGTLYYLKANEIKLKQADKVTALKAAKTSYQYYIDTTKEKGSPTYRDVQSGLLKIEKQLQELSK